MTLFRVFLERRSGKLVARDTERRQYRRQVLQPAIDEVEALVQTFTRLSDILEQTPKAIGPDARREMATLKAILESGTSFTYAVRLETFPAVAFAEGRVRACLRPLANFIEEDDGVGACRWLRMNAHTILRRTALFHRAVERELFGHGVLRAGYYAFLFVTKKLIWLAFRQQMWREQRMVDKQRRSAGSA